MYAPRLSRRSAPLKTQRKLSAAWRIFLALSRATRNQDVHIAHNVECDDIAREGG